MLAIGLRRCYINITITILDIIHRPVYYIKHDVSETGFYLPLQVWTMLSLIGGLCSCWLYKPYWCCGSETETSSICWARLNRFHLKTETESSLRIVVLWIKTRRWIMSRIVTDLTPRSWALLGSRPLVQDSSSPEDGNRSSCRNVLFLSYLEFQTMDKVHKHSDSEILSTIYV
jgi:hypothetical protein